MAIRGRGLNFDYLLKKENYKTFIFTILERDNPLFYGILDKKQLMTSKIFKTRVGMDIIKVKLLLDIVCYNEYHFFDNTDFAISD